MPVATPYHTYLEVQYAIDLMLVVLCLGVVSGQPACLSTREEDVDVGGAPPLPPHQYGGETGLEGAIIPFFFFKIKQISIVFTLTFSIPIMLTSSR